MIYDICLSLSDFLHLICYSLGPSMLLKMAIFHFLWLSSMPLCVCICICIYICICVCVCIYIYIGFPGGSDDEESACNAGDLGSIPGLGRSPGGGYGNPLQYSCLENPLGQSSLAAYSPWGCKESDVAK